MGFGFWRLQAACSSVCIAGLEMRERPWLLLAHGVLRRMGFSSLLLSYTADCMADVVSIDGKGLI